MPTRWPGCSRYRTISRSCSRSWAEARAWTRSRRLTAERFGGRVGWAHRAHGRRSGPALARRTREGSGMPARSGQEYVESLKKSAPCVYLEGRRVEDVTAEPVFREPI